jgi:hypothetical protein
VHVGGLSVQGRRTPTSSEEFDELHCMERNEGGVGPARQWAHQELPVMCGVRGR